MAINEQSEASVATNSLSSSSSSLSSFFFQSIAAERDDEREECSPATCSPGVVCKPKWAGWWFRPSPSSPATATDSATSTLHCGPSCGRSCQGLVKHGRCAAERHPRHHHCHVSLLQPKLNSLTLQLTVALVLTTIFACFPCPVGSSTSSFPGSDKNETLVCVEGFSPSFPGATFPRGDIFLKEGDTLEVTCKLNLTHPKIEGYNASNIEFKFTKADIPRENVITTVVNETTAVVRVKNMTASSPYLQCLVKKADGRSLPVCQNQVDVGYPPLKVENFRCVVKYWRSLHCTWKLPPNPIPTKYTLSMMYVGARNIFPIQCPNQTVTPTSCTWGPRTDPHYYQNRDPIHLKLNGTNALVPTGSTWDYTFPLGTIVIPEKPELFVKKLNDTNMYSVNWTFTYYENFQPGLDHLLQICHDQPSNEPCNVSRIHTKPVNGSMIPFREQKVVLPYANWKYTISVRLRSPIANKSEEFWSDPAVAEIITDSRAPDFPPETDVGSFETVVKNHTLRDINIYWKSVPDQFKNGPGFKYEILVFENARPLGMKPQVLSESYAKFPNLSTENSYYFRITAVNALGRSKSHSEITVPSTTTLPEGPKSVSKLDFTNGSFEISWKRPDRYSGIHSYTVFHCTSKKPRPYPCEGRLEWDRVIATAYDTNHKFYNFLAHHSDRLYQFAVSANSDGHTSGMVWATCTLLHNKIPGKLKTVRFEEKSEDEIVIKWDLECSYQAGDIEAFKIIYCQVEKSPAERCKDDEKAEAVEGANITTYTLKKLKPYTTYKIYVLIIGAAGQSPRSDPIRVITSEGAPSHASISEVSRVTNVSATLHIKSPQDWNGILREYRIYYRSHDGARELERTVDLQVSNDTNNDFITEVTLTNLSSNSNYSVHIVTCTRKCSTRAGPFSFLTDIGYTDFNVPPKIAFTSGGYVEVNWNRPEIWGGSITYFQVRLKRDGVTLDLDDNTEKFTPDLTTFHKLSSERCEPSTNFSAQVRAVTTLVSGEILYGDWSPEGIGSCGGTISWLIWLILVIVAVSGITFFGYLSIRFYNYFRRMKEGPTIKLPPGLNLELNGFAHKPPPRSRSNDNSYGKETYAYPLQPTNSQADESKDFLSSSEMNQAEAEESLIEKPFCPSPTNPLLGVLSNGSAVAVEPVPGPSSRSTPSTRSEVDELSSTSPSHTISQISNHHPSNPSSSRGEPAPTANGITRTVPDVLSSSPSSPTSLSPSATPSGAPASAAPAPPAAAAPPASSSYVKWTTLVPDMKTGDAGSVLDSNNRQAYCQVGILLDS